ncbi:MAG: cytochrome ubiquinol oxidase subunit I [Candidatus Gracilibacteria bacterium]|nr:cytochrome ubiquinol oxidase subunit I [Candidatus Gracilibacteria bacterium]
MVDVALVDWSRALFALTALYHWLFVPFTLGVTFIIAIMETIYIRTGNSEWKKIAQFWIRVFAINFAIGVATGIILEFEFGTNWSNYSWFVGDIFGAPLAIEGIMAFFMETTFLAILLFGWGRVSDKVHMFAAWMTAIGSNLSAVWILIANGWMQNPVGMVFNPESMRNEMGNFWEVIFNPAGMDKFLHTISSSYTFASVLVVGISAWYLLKKRERSFAKKSIIVASTFGLIASTLNIVTGDISGQYVAQKQTMKLASIEALYDGQEGAPFTVFATFADKNNDGIYEKYNYIEIPKALSLLLGWNTKFFVPGVNDLLYGNSEYGIVSYIDRIRNGKIAIQALADFREAKKAGDETAAEVYLTTFRQYEKDFGYGYFDETNLGELVPHIPILFYSFRYMLLIGFTLPLFLLLILISTYRNKIDKNTFLQKTAILFIPLVYLATELGWVVAEVGRQPWVIQNLMPTKMGMTSNTVGDLQFVFFMFAIIFTILLIAALKIVIAEIIRGPKIEESK